MRTEFSDLIRAMARRDWGTVDQLLDGLEASGWQGGNQVIGAAFALAINDRFAVATPPPTLLASSPTRAPSFPARSHCPRWRWKGSSAWHSVRSG
ncbi:hypothetical protein GCM10009848_09550 [Micromonospora lupini]